MAVHLASYTVRTAAIESNFDTPAGGGSAGETRYIMNNKKLYVAYGSNLNVRQMALRCPDARVAGAGVLKNYQLEFWGWPGHGVATVTPKSGYDVPVGLWEISEADEQSLDVYEGWPNLYRKENIEVLLDTGETVTAMVYLMNEVYHGERIRRAAPSNTYLSTILQGYSNFNFSRDALQRAYRPFR